jgi:hypothetical protein
MERAEGSQLKTVLCGVALVALATIPPAEAQTNPCTGSGGFSGGVCNRFDSTHLTNKYQFGDNFIKFTIENVINPFDLNVELRNISDTELDARVIPPLAPVDCIPYDGATDDTNLGTCVFYHVTNPPVRDVDYSGDVDVRIFWDHPSLAVLHNVRIYRAPLDGVPPDGTCTQGFDCYTQDITDAVFAVGDSSSDPGAGGKSKGFSDFEAVDATSATSLAARVWIGLKKSSDAGILFDLKAVVTRNGNAVSSGELLGAPGGGKGFQNANLLTIPLSLPDDEFQSGDNVSIKVFVRNSCLGSPVSSGSARLWSNDAAANSRFDEPGTPTLYLVRGDDDGEKDFDDHGDNGGDLSQNPGNGPRKKRNVTVHAPDPSCNGAYKSFGKWSGKVPN